MLLFYYSLRFAPASALWLRPGVVSLNMIMCGVVLSPYLRKINSTCRVSQRSQKCHRVCTKICTLSKIKIGFRFRIERVTCAYNTLLHCTTSFLGWLRRRKALVNGHQLWIGSSNYLALQFVTMSGSLILYPSPWFPAFKNASFAQKACKLYGSHISRFPAVFQLGNIFKSDDKTYLHTPHPPLII